eukprot:jgi/Astpho2/8545/Aster-05579
MLTVPKLKHHYEQAFMALFKEHVPPGWMAGRPPPKARHRCGKRTHIPTPYDFVTDAKIARVRLCVADLALHEDPYHKL